MFVISVHKLMLTAVSQIEVGCSRIWGLKPTTQTQVSGTPRKPAQPAPQPRAPPATPDLKTSTRHMNCEFNGKPIEERRPLLPWIGRGGRGNTRKHIHQTLSQAKPRGHAQAHAQYAREPLTAKTARRRPRKAPHGLIHLHATNAAGTPPHY